MRGTILQPWHWHTPGRDAQGNGLWRRVERDAAEYARLGFTAVWLPPASQGQSRGDVGYGIRDWYDLDNSKYGTGDQLVAACRELSRLGVQVYHDQVHNHLMGGELETGIWCLSVKANNKNEPRMPDSQWFQSDVYTSFPWLGLDHDHFDAYHHANGEIYAIRGKQFDREAKLAPLMGCDLDFDSIDLVMKLRQFGQHFRRVVGVDGYRFDAVKHIRPKGTLGFLQAMREAGERNLFAVGEFASDNLGDLDEYLQQTDHQISLFDFPLQRKLVRLSQENEHGDLQSLGHGTLTRHAPLLSVSFVHSHDDQPPTPSGEARGGYVGEWFVPHAYALLLLRDEGYPCVFAIDLETRPQLTRRLMLARRHCTYGSRLDRFDHPNTVGWAFTGEAPFDNSMAVVMSNGTDPSKWLFTGRPRTRYRDLLGWPGAAPVTDDDGWANFRAPDRGVAVWVEESKNAALVAP